VHLLRYVVTCTVTDSPFNTEANCSKCTPSNWMNFLTRVTRELVTLQSTAALLMFLAALRIQFLLHVTYHFLSSIGVSLVCLLIGLIRCVMCLSDIQQRHSEFLQLTADYTH